MIILLPSQLAQPVRQLSLREPALQPQALVWQPLLLQLQAHPRAWYVPYVRLAYHHHDAAHDACARHPKSFRRLALHHWPDDHLCKPKP
jgi:hypothetical protein